MRRTDAVLCLRRHEAAADIAPLRTQRRSRARIASRRLMHSVASLHFGDAPRAADVECQRAPLRGKDVARLPNNWGWNSSARVSSRNHRRLDYDGRRRGATPGREPRVRMLSAPDPYPVASNSNPAPDDAQIEHKMPSICVDYLSHEWKDEDVWSSWKAMTKRKNEIANGVRLENASWRTWAKQRGKLKTISPETLNWCVEWHGPTNRRLKESDVTWLYGPLHGESETVEAVPPHKVATTAERLGIEDSRGKKSILKQRTLSQLLTTPYRVASPTIGDEMLPRFEVPQHRPEANVLHEELEQIASGAATPPSRGIATPKESESPASEGARSRKANRHISFNNRVEQCIAVDLEPAAYDDYKEEENELEYNESESDAPQSDEDDDGSELSLHSRLVLSDEPLTIAKLQPTRLKTSGTFAAPSPQIVDPSGLGDDADDLDDSFDDDEDAQYSLSADPTPVTEDLRWDDREADDYLESDDEYDPAKTSSSIFAQSVSLYDDASRHSALESPIADTLPSPDSHTTDTDSSSPSITHDAGAAWRGRRANDASAAAPADDDASPRYGTTRSHIIPQSPTASPSTDLPDQRLMVDVLNLPGVSMDARARSAQLASARGGPTPQNTPTTQLRTTRASGGAHSESRLAASSTERDPVGAFQASRDHPAKAPSGAIVAPSAHMPSVPLAEDYVEEHEGGLISSAVEILNTARDLLGTLISTGSEQRRAWYE